ncbi:UNVERIFIED_CONTAM: glycosyl hydrolase family 11 [Acetivibrio alkalicellulosi]
MKYYSKLKVKKINALFLCFVMISLLFSSVVVQANQQIYSLANDSVIRGINGSTGFTGSPNLQRAGSGDNNPRIFVNVHNGNRSIHVTSRNQAWHGFDILARPLNLRVGDTIQVNGRVARGTVMQLGGVNNAGNSWPSLTTATGNASDQFSLNLTLTQAHINASPDGFRIRTDSNATIQFHVDQIYVTRPGGTTQQPRQQQPSQQQPSPQQPSNGRNAPSEPLNFIHNWDSGNMTSQGSGTSRSSLGTATANFDLSRGTISANWTTARAGNQFNNLHGLGWRVGRHDRSIGYNLGYLNHTSGQQGMTIAGFYGWTRSPLIEYYVLDNWLNHRSTPGRRIGTFTSDGGTYEVWRDQRNGHHIEGMGPFIQLKSVRTQVRPTGQNHTITFLNHVNAWGNFGQQMGSQWDYQAYIIEGWESNGSGNATVWPN